MKFEHLIEINNFNTPGVTHLNRDQIWKGLVLRAKAPDMFIEHMDSADVMLLSDTSVSRVLNYGKFKVTDTVTLYPPEKLVFEVPAQGEIIASKLTITIEEPFEMRFFVRFVYEDDALDEGPEAMYNDFRRSAYKEADIDSIRLIRKLVESGQIK